VAETDENVRSDPAARGEETPRIEERYSVVREVGRGGMGRVFEARDRKLGRQVAIKLLAAAAHSEDRLRRFEQEARAAGSLDHPNILAVHDIGTCESGPYIVSELLVGGTLRQHLRERPLPLQKAVDYAGQLARGLSAAHGKGIVHRDIKPENLFITNEGSLKILDFGIAKLVPRETGPTLDLDQALPPPSTDTGAIIGTVGYMSPEQVRGEHVDHRSDLFSFGVILFEMLAGSTPFARRSAVETGYAILNDAPPPLPGDTPSALDGLVRRCLAKRPGDRFQSARELIDGLAGAAGPPAASPRRSSRRALAVGAAIAVIALAIGAWRLRPVVRRPPPSVAVLPLVNMSSDKESEYFSDGITEELINALANVPGLRVASRTAVFAMRGKKLGIREIASELKVGALVEGTIRRDGNTVRVTVQLIDVADGYHLWSKTYAIERKSIFAVEDEIARSVAGALQQTLVGVKPATADPEAHDLYLRGLHLWNQRTGEASRKARVHFEEAIRRDPRYALAHAGLANALMALVWVGQPHTPETVAPARRAAERALELDPQLAEAQASIGLTAYFLSDWPEALARFRRAVQLNPNYAMAHKWIGNVLLFTGHLPEAGAAFERALQADPTSLVANANLGHQKLIGRDYAGAVEQFQKTLRLDPGFDMARLGLLTAYAWQGRYADALAEIDKLSSLPGSELQPDRAKVLALAGRRAEALSIARELEARSGHERVSDFELATVWIALGDNEKAFAALQSACARHELLGDNSMKVARLYDPLRSDPRFDELLRCAKLK